MLDFCDTVRDFGIIFDKELNFSAHINPLIRNRYYMYQLRQLRILFLVSFLLMQLLPWSMLFHSFIHSGVFYSASLRFKRLLLRGAPMAAQSRTKKKDFKEMLNLEGWAIRKDRSSKGRSFHADRPTTKMALLLLLVGLIIAARF